MAVPHPTVPGDARVPDPRPAPQALAPCLCGHDHDSHRHWRRGSDCGTCGPGACVVYRARGGSVRRLLRWLGLIG